MDKRIAVIGDIHGEADKLQELIERIQDKYGAIDLYQVGDLTDRGPDPRRVIQICIDNHIECQVGNVKDYLVCQRETPGIFSNLFGAPRTFESYGIDFGAMKKGSVNQLVKAAFKELF